MRALLAGAVAVVLAACSSAPPDDALVVVTRGDLVLTVEVTGELEAVDSTDVMPPPLPDVWEFKIAQLADEGDEVAAGAPVVGFDASNLEQELDSLRNEADAAAQKLAKRRIDAALARKDEALRLEEAEATLRKAALKAGALADQTAAIELKLLAADHRLAELALERARNHAAATARADAAELASLAEQLAYAKGRLTGVERNIAAMTIAAPRAGTVVYPTSWRGDKRKVGDSVWRMQAVVQVVSLDHMIGRGLVDEVDLARVADGQPVSLRLDALPDVQLHGEVQDIAKNVGARSDTDPSKVAQVKLRLTDTDGQPLRPGMRFRGDIETARIPDVVVVPVAAVFVTAAGPVAYRVVGGEVTAVPVTLGRRNATTIEVVSGLAVGDRVSRIDPTRGAP
ncbi:MAG: HlyD family efflux transporter periplasmic adaptor subunit [Kofleriaceae bacterium]